MWEHLKSSDKKIVLYGTGNACERIMRLMDARGLKPASIFASDDFVRGQIFHGIPVESYSAVKSRFGADGMIYYSIACCVSYVLSGYTGLYSSQRILYDKLKAQYIDVYANAHLEGERTEAEKRFGDLSRGDKD